MDQQQEGLSEAGIQAPGARLIAPKLMDIVSQGVDSLARSLQTFRGNQVTPSEELPKLLETEKGPNVMAFFVDGKKEVWERTPFDKWKVRVAGPVYYYASSHPNPDAPEIYDYLPIPLDRLQAYMRNKGAISLYE